MAWDDVKNTGDKLTAAEYNAMTADQILRILKSLFDANTILKADSDDTPIALTIAEQRILGRITAGSITGLTAAQVRTLCDVPSTSEAVLDTLFDAYSILYADTDNTPAALTIAPSRLVGRKAAGGIAALTAAEARTLLSVSQTSDIVLKSLYDAYSILYADTDNTPAALTVAASRFVGRKAAGGIAAMTVAEAKTLLAIAIADISDIPGTIASILTDHNKAAHDALNIDADTVDSCDTGVATGNIFKIPASIAQGDIFYVDGSGNIVRLPHGTNGHFLKTQGAAANPVWAAGAAVFTGLTDTPAAYATHAGKIVKVNATPDALEFGMLESDIFKKDGSVKLTGNLIRSADNNYTGLWGGENSAARIVVYGNNHGISPIPGRIEFYVPNAAKNNVVLAGHFQGVTDTPFLDLDHGLKVNKITEHSVGGITFDRDIILDSADIMGAQEIYGEGEGAFVQLGGGATNPARIRIYGKDAATYGGQTVFKQPNAAKSAVVDAGYFEGVTDTPKLVLNHGLTSKKHIYLESEDGAGHFMGLFQLCSEGKISVYKDAVGWKSPIVFAHTWAEIGQVPSGAVFVDEISVNDKVKTDVIDEFQNNAGVTIDTCLIKDGYPHIPNHTPSAANDTGTAGQICYDASYIYMCVATDTWKRVAISTW